MRCEQLYLALGPGGIKSCKKKATHTVEKRDREGNVYLAEHFCAKCAQRYFGQEQVRVTEGVEEES